VALVSEVDAELLVARADLARYGSKRLRDGMPAMWQADLIPAPSSRECEMAV
jgi:hypothetical protein